MRKIEIFNEKQPDYRYMILPEDNKADVFVYKFFEEIQDNDTTYYSHYFNQFTVEVEKVTEEMIKNDIEKYLDYSPEETKVTFEDRINALEDALMEIVSGGVEV